MRAKKGLGRGRERSLCIVLNEQKVAAVGNVESQRKCGTCKNQGQEALRKRSEVTNYFFVLETVVWNIRPLYWGPLRRLT